MGKVKIAVLVSGGGTNLQALMDAGAAGAIPHGEIALVISNKQEAYALRRAQSAGIEALCIPGGSPDFEDRLQSALESRGIGLIVLAGFLRILSPQLTESWAGRIINVHPSLIPSFCGEGYYGLRVHRAALDRGVKWTGATVHYVNSIPDGGEIILQKPVAVLPGDTPETLQKRVMQEAEWIILPQAAELVAKKLSEAQENDRHL